MSPATRSILVLGGARSGKSAYAVEIALGSGLTPVLVATAQALDAEMEERIAHHRAGRDAGWSVVEEPLDLPACLVAQARPDRILVVDCLTLWLTNVMLAGRDIASQSRDLEKAVRDAGGPVVLVSNEVGLGIVPDNALARSFRDVQGRLNQSLAATCDHVILVSAGLPLVLKPPPRPVFGF